MEKRLLRSKQNKVIAGVCGGFGEYFGIDPAIIRIVWVILSFASSGMGFIGYIIAMFIIPQNAAGTFNKNMGDSQNDWRTNTCDEEIGKDDMFKSQGSGKGSIVVGALLVFMGVVFLAQRFFHWVNMRNMWPVILIALGAIIVLKGRRDVF